MDPLEATRLVRAAGGVPVVAHPMSENRGPALPLEYLGQMVDAGLAGVEVYHRENSEPNRARLLEFARDRELLVTGSSDYHGAGKPNRLGENTTAAKLLRRSAPRFAAKAHSRTKVITVTRTLCRISYG